MTDAVPNVTDVFMNTSPSEEMEPPLEEQSEIILNLLTTFVFLISFVGFSGNSFVIFLHIRSVQLRDATAKFILNLAVTDLIMAIYIAIYEILLIVDHRLTSTSRIGCLIWEQILTILMLVSQCVIAVATFDRYIAICHHVKYTKIMTNTVMMALILTAWVGPICLATIPFFGFNKFDEEPFCIFEFLLPDWLYYTFSSVMITLMAIPFILYIQIFRKAIVFYRRFNAAHRETSKGDNEENERIRKRKKAIKNGKVMGIVTLIFMICWLPFQINQFFFGSHFDDNYRFFSATTYYLGILNCTVNPFIYTLQKKSFKEEAKKFLTCRRQRRDESAQAKQKEVERVNKKSDSSSRDAPYDKTLASNKTDGQTSMPISD